VQTHANGVTVIQPAHAFAPRRTNASGWTIPFRHEGEHKEIVARFLVDASGGCLPGRRLRLSAPLLALHAQWDIAGCGLEGQVEAAENEWFWCGPTSPETAVAAVFIDPKRLARMNCDIASAYHELLAGFRLFRAMGARSRMVRVAACDASSRAADICAGSDFIRVGDACLSLDPLSSQGVQTAVASGLQGATVVNTLLRLHSRCEAAVEFHLQRQRQRARRYTAKTAAFYAERAAVCNTPFWRQRGNIADLHPALELQNERLESACKLRLSTDAQIRTTPVVQGDFIAKAPVLRHDLLETDVAFVGGIEVVPLVEQIRPGLTAGEIAETWSERLPIDLCWKILNWLWFHRIFVPFDETS